MKKYTAVAAVLVLGLAACGKDTSDVCEKMNRGLECQGEATMTQKECEQTFERCDSDELERWEDAYECTNKIVCSPDSGEEMSWDEIGDVLGCTLKAPLGCVDGDL